MSQFRNYVQELFKWNEDMKKFLGSQEVETSTELWEQLDRFTVLIENSSNSGQLSDTELLNLQTEAEHIHEKMENYFNRKRVVGTIWVNEKVIPPGEHTLPALPYAYNALEPYISEEIMRLHHDKHHQSYVDGLNKAELKLRDARKTGDFSLIKHWSRELAFHGSGHYLHTIFWNNMTPNGGGRPQGPLKEKIDSYFGSFDNFKKQFSEAAKQVEGVGWALLVWSPRARHLEILQSERHMLLTQWDTIPLLVLDVWEHAYYLQYKNNRGEYVENWWEIVNWNDVELRFDQAAEIKWPAF
jgi:superoxide dismutase, Fe-Mn family